MITRKVDHNDATVGARTDIDGLVPRVVLNPNRQAQDEQIELTFDPATARRVARLLNKWARAVDGIAR